MTVQCLSCNDKGFVVFDGVKRACSNGCEESQRWQRQEAATVRPGLDPHRMAPGADVLAARDAAQAAGVPAGAVGQDVLVQATLAVEPLVYELVAALDAVLTDQPGARDRARVLLERLPPWAHRPEPDDTEGSAADITTEPSRSGRRRPSAAPLEAPE